MDRVIRVGSEDSQISHNDPRISVFYIHRLALGKSLHPSSAISREFAWKFLENQSSLVFVEKTYVKQ